MAVLNAVPGITGSFPPFIGFGTDKRRLYAPASASGRNKVRVWTFRINSVTVKYPSAQCNMYGVGCVVASAGKSHTGRQR